MGPITVRHSELLRHGSGNKSSHPLVVRTAGHTTDCASTTVMERDGSINLDVGYCVIIETKYFEFKLSLCFVILRYLFCINLTRLASLVDRKWRHLEMKSR